MDDFERDSVDGSSGLYEGDLDVFSLTTTPVKNGDKALEAASGQTGLITSPSGLDFYPSPGDVWEVWVRLNDAGAPQHWFALQDRDNAYEFSATPSDVKLFVVDAGSFTELDGQSISTPTGTYIRALLAYGGDVISVMVDDGPGTEFHGTLSERDSTYANGGDIGWRQYAGDADSGDKSYIDYARPRNDINDLSDSAWSPSKESTNPITSGTSGNSNQSYIPSVAKGPNGTFYMVTKSSPYLWGWSSSDGVSWTDEGQVLSLGADGTWDDTKHTFPVLQYNPGDSTWYLFYAGDADSGGTPRKVGLATSSSPLSGYTKESSNPIADASGVGSNYDMLQFMDHVIHNGTHYWFGFARDKNSSNPWKLVAYSGSDWMSPSFNTVLLNRSNIPLAGEALIGTNAFVDGDGRWRWTFTAGYTADVWNEMRVYSADGTSPTDFTPREDVMLAVGNPGSWEERRVYDSIWLKKQDGSYKSRLKPDGTTWLYYAGHNIAGSSASKAFNALARYDTVPAPSEMATL